MQPVVLLRQQKITELNLKKHYHKEVLDAFLTLTRTEGIIPALESAHAISEAMKVAKKGKVSESIVVTLSGRGDKDVEEVQKYLDADNI